MSPLIFKCGGVICGPPGYQFCFQAPLVAPGEEECWDCKLKEHLCDTTRQQYGCELYCQDLKPTIPPPTGVPVLSIIIPVVVLVVVILGLVVTFIIYKRCYSQRRRGINNVVDNMHASPAECSELTLSSSKSTVSSDKESQDSMTDKHEGDPGTEEETKLLQKKSPSTTVTLPDEEDTDTVKNKDKFNQIPPSSPHSDIPYVATTMSGQR